MFAGIDARTFRAGVATLSSWLDRVFGTTRGALLFRGANGWALLPPSPTAGQLLSSNGVGADPSYITASGTGTVTNFSASSTDLSTSVANPTTTPALTANLQVSPTTAPLYAWAQSEFGGL